MAYNYKKIKNEIENLVKKACYSPNNKYTETVWDFHILPVVKYSLKLGKKLKADLEIVELASLLHDYAVLLNFKLTKEHHLHGAKLAEEILSKRGFLPEKIEKIKDCIMSHRGSLKIPPKTIEAKIIASADAMSHITELADMFYLTFGINKYKTTEGAKWLKGKLNRSWAKTMPEGKKLIKKEYVTAMNILNKAIK